MRALQRPPKAFPFAKARLDPAIALSAHASGPAHGRGSEALDPPGSCVRPPRPWPPAANIARPSSPSSASGPARRAANVAASSPLRVGGPTRLAMVRRAVERRPSASSPFARRRPRSRRAMSPRRSSRAALRALMASLSSHANAPLRASPTTAIRARLMRPASWRKAERPPSNPRHFPNAAVPDTDGYTV